MYTQYGSVPEPSYPATPDALVVTMAPDGTAEVRRNDDLTRTRFRTAILRRHGRTVMEVTFSDPVGGSDRYYASPRPRDTLRLELPAEQCDDCDGTWLFTRLP